MTMEEWIKLIGKYLDLIDAGRILIRDLEETEQKGFVYLISNNNDEYIYVGETGSTVKKRLRGIYGEDSPLVWRIFLDRHQLQKISVNPFSLPIGEAAYMQEGTATKIGFQLSRKAIIEEIRNYYIQSVYMGAEIKDRRLLEKITAKFTNCKYHDDLSY